MISPSGKGPLEISGLNPGLLRSTSFDFSGVFHVFAALMNDREKNLLARGDQEGRQQGSRKVIAVHNREVQAVRNRPLQRAATQRAETQPPPAPEARPS